MKNYLIVYSEFPVDDRILRDWDDDMLMTLLRTLIKHLRAFHDMEPAYAVYGSPIRRATIFDLKTGRIVYDIIDEVEMDKDYVDFPNA